MDTEAKPGVSTLNSKISEESISTHAVLSSGINCDAEKKLVRKLDLFIVPPFMMLYLFSFLDRYAFKNATCLSIICQHCSNIE